MNNNIEKECEVKERCIRYGYECGSCARNPKAKLEDEFVDRGYVPVCSDGFDDCIHDPARKLYDYDNNCSWTRKTYTREELVLLVSQGCECDDEYDNEDK